MANQVFLFYGDEELLIRQRIDEFKAAIENPGLNIETYHADEAETEKIIDALQAQSLLGGERLLVIRNLDLKSDLGDALLSGLERLSEGTTVVIWAAAVDKRSKLYKWIDQKGEVCEFKSFAPWEEEQVVGWIKRRAQSLGKAIKEEAAAKLQEICGNSLQKLASEIEKLATYAGEKKEIEKSDVLALASPSEINIFALSDAVARKDLKEALASFALLCRSKMEMFSLLSLLAGQYRIMLLAKQEKNPQRLAVEVGASPYYVKKCAEKAAAFKEEELQKKLELILETDLKLKTGEPQLPVMELLLASLCAARAE